MSGGRWPDRRISDALAERGRICAEHLGSKVAGIAGAPTGAVTTPSTRLASQASFLSLCAVNDHIDIPAPALAADKPGLPIRDGLAAP
jgi:hypothetical protein